MARRRKKVDPIHNDTIYHYTYYIQRLKPTPEQKEAIKFHCKQMHVCARWLQDTFLNPSNKRGVDRTASFASRQVKLLVTGRIIDYDLPETFLPFIKEVGPDAFYKMASMTASEHFHMPYRKGGIVKWTRAYEEDNRGVTFCDSVAQDSNSFRLIKNSGGEILIHTKEFGTLKPYGIYSENSPLFLAYSDTKPKFYLYPQISADFNVDEYFIRFVIAYIIDPSTLTNISTKPSKFIIPDSYNGLYNKDAATFFSDFGSYYNYPKV